MKNEFAKSPSELLPIKGNLSSDFVLSIFVAILMTAASIGGLLFPSSIYPTEELRQSYLANDVINLVIGLPILLGSMWLTQRGKLLGLLCWPGALLYNVYNYIAYIFGLPLSWLTLVFVVIVLLSAYPVFDLLKNIDRDALKTKLAGAVSEKFSGVLLALFGVAFFFLAVGVITGANADQTISMADVGVAIADIFLSVILVIGGVLLFLRNPFGYASGMGLLFAASALFVGVILVVLLQPLLTDAPFVMKDIVVLSGMALVCFIPTGLFMRGVLSSNRK
jgi:hypothetical protein